MPFKKLVMNSTCTPLSYNHRNRFAKTDEYTTVSQKETHMKNTFLMKAAIAGLIGTAALAATPVQAADAAEKGHCVGANACSGKGGCKQVGQNECKGKNGCKGKGFLEKTKAQCDALSKKNKDVHFETAMMK
jgi:hypothetical protein